jgi:hypothetical protein
MKKAIFYVALRNLISGFPLQTKDEDLWTDSTNV